MGLDQYAKKVKREYNHETLTETVVKTEIGYWRKHNALEGYMSDLYRTKTGDQGEFNCKTLSLGQIHVWIITTLTTGNNEMIFRCDSIF